MQNDPPPSMPLTQKIELTKRMMQIVALSAMVGLRHDLGYRFVNPIHLIVIVVAMGMAGSVASESFDPSNGGNGLILASFFVLVLGLAQRSTRMKEMRKGVLQHSYYIGTSMFAHRSLPLWLRCNRRFERFLDPLACMLCGAFLLQSEHALGVWLIVSGACLRFVEATVERNERYVNMDMVDNVIVSKVQSHNIEQYEEIDDVRFQREDNGLPTGLASDIEASIERRKKTKKRAWRFCNAPGSTIPRWRGVLLKIRQNRFFPGTDIIQWLLCLLIFLPIMCACMGIGVDIWNEVERQVALHRVLTGSQFSWWGIGDSARIKIVTVPIIVISVAIGYRCTIYISDWHLRLIRRRAQRRGQVSTFPGIIPADSAREG